ncbi:MAG TPA: aminopeptidase, partial [Thermoplasmata archaeon]|nr:aminopeptidase [Thermoplasmata archaeon]
MTPNRKQVRDCAKNMVDTCNVKRGDSVVVRGGAHAQELLEEVSLQCYRKGAVPMMMYTSDRYSKAVYDEIPASVLSTVPKQYVGLVKESDLLIIIEELEDPSIAERFPRAKLVARQKAMLPVIDIVYHPTDGKKWLYAGWPTAQAARSYGVPYKQLEDLIVGGMTVPPKTLMAIGRKIAGRLKNASWVHVWDGKGTDFRVRIEGRRLNIDDAYISKADYSIGDRGANLPAGEVFVAPHETQGEGTIYCPVTRDRMSEKILRGVRLEFRKGKLLLDRAEADSGTDQLVASFMECRQIDRARYSPIRTSNIAELGVGFNPKIKKAIGYILTDEKVSGTVHLAFGANNTYGGTSESVMHWDFVSAPGVNIEVERDNGRT